MMGIFLYLIFMIPLFMFNCWFIIQFLIILLMIYFMSLNFNFFFGSLSYFMGIDYFSYMLIILTFYIVTLMMLSSNMIQLSFNSMFFIFNCLLICFLLVLVFCVLNFILLYLFFEFTLVPLMIMVLGWGYQPERLFSALYLFFYTLFGSLPLFSYIVYLYINFYSLFIDFNYDFSHNFITHFIMVFAFLVKFPMFLVHFWLPSAHVQAPVAGSMILAGLMLKIGGYGIYRFMICFESLFFNYSYIWFSLSLIGSLFSCLICFFQGDLKCMIAYSSICHMGLCLCGLISLTKIGVLGSLLMMISHGLCSSGLFFMANCYYERVMSRSFYLNSGLIYFMPSMTLFWFLLCSFNMSCPPSLNFISEVFIVISVLSYWSGSFIFLMLISFMCACFSFYLYSYVNHGLFSNFYSYAVVHVREYLISFVHLFPLLILLFYMGFLV